ncbi:hypothetical protein VTJ83DRAFT_1446 [Remersonia thermophila]|uniref:Small secreted protein n=1 Tax=Remersonia thermophila TaxID=72144 RepID=A0ABR4DP23_9PEZI
MQLSVITVGIFAMINSAFAAPTLNEREKEVSAMADVPQWTLQSFQRTCNKEDTFCTVTFHVNNKLEPRTPCMYSIKGASASRAPVNGITCGPYTISSGWSGQFGEGNGFTTWSIVDWNKRLIVWPAYADHELVNGQIVTPDKSFAPQTLA